MAQATSTSSTGVKASDSGVFESIEARRKAQALRGYADLQFGEAEIHPGLKVKDAIGLEPHVKSGSIYQDSFNPSDLYQHVMSVKSAKGYKLEPRLMQSLQTNAENYEGLLSKYVYHKSGIVQLDTTRMGHSSRRTKKSVEPRVPSRSRTGTVLIANTPLAKSKEAEEARQFLETEHKMNDDQLDDYYSQLMYVRRGFRDNMGVLMNRHPDVMNDVIQEHAMERQVVTKNLVDQLKTTARASARQNPAYSQNIQEAISLVESGDASVEDVHQWLKEQRHLSSAIGSSAQAREKAAARKIRKTRERVTGVHKRGAPLASLMSSVTEQKIPEPSDTTVTTTKVSAKASPPSPTKVARSSAIDNAKANVDEAESKHQDVLRQQTTLLDQAENLVIGMKKDNGAPSRDVKDILKYISEYIRPKLSAVKGYDAKKPITKQSKAVIKQLKGDDAKIILVLETYSRARVQARKTSAMVVRQKKILAQAQRASKTSRKVKPPPSPKRAKKAKTPTPPSTPPSGVAVSTGIVGIAPTTPPPKVKGTPKKMSPKRSLTKTSAQVRKALDEFNKQHGTKLRYRRELVTPANMGAYATAALDYNAMNANTKRDTIDDLIRYLNMATPAGFPAISGELVKEAVARLGGDSSLIDPAMGPDEIKNAAINQLRSRRTKVAQNVALQEERPKNLPDVQFRNPLSHHYERQRIQERLKSEEGASKHRIEYDDRVVYEARNQQELQQLRTLDDLYEIDPVTGRLKKMQPAQLKMFHKYVQMKKKSIGGSFWHTGSYLDWKNNSLASNRRHSHIHSGMMYIPQRNSNLTKLSNFVRPKKQGKHMPTHMAIGAGFFDSMEKAWKKTKHAVSTAGKAVVHELHNDAHRVANQANKLLLRTGQDALDIKQSWENIGNDVKKAITHPTVHNLIRAGISPFAAIKDTAVGMLDSTDATLAFIQHAPGFREANFVAQLVPGVGQTLFAGETALGFTNAMVQGNYKKAAVDATVGGIALGLAGLSRVPAVRNVIAKGTSSLRGVLARDVAEGLTKELPSKVPVVGGGLYSSGKFDQRGERHGTHMNHHKGHHGKKGGTLHGGGFIGDVKNAFNKAKKGVSDVGHVLGDYGAGAGAVFSDMPRQTARMFQGKDPDDSTARKVQKVVDKRHPVKKKSTTELENAINNNKDSLKQFVGGSLATGVVDGVLARGGVQAVENATNAVMPNLAGAMRVGAAQGAVSVGKKALATGLGIGGVAGGVVGAFNKEIGQGVKSAGKAISHLFGGSLGTGGSLYHQHHPQALSHGLDIPTGGSFGSNVYEGVDIHNMKNKLPTGPFPSMDNSHPSLANATRGGSLLSGGAISSNASEPPIYDDWLTPMNGEHILWEMRRLAEYDERNVQLPYNEWDRKRMDDLTPGPHHGPLKVRSPREITPIGSLARGGSLKTGGRLIEEPYMPHLNAANHDIHARHHVGENVRGRINKALLGQSSGQVDIDNMAQGVKGAGFSFKEIQDRANKLSSDVRYQAKKPSNQLGAAVGLAGVAGLATGVAGDMLVSTLRGDAITRNFTQNEIAQGIAADFKGSGAQSRLFNNIPGRGDYTIDGVNPQPLGNAAAEARAAKNAGYVIDGLGGDARAAGEAISSSVAKSASKNVGQEIVGGLETAGKAVGNFFEKESGNILKGLFEGAGFGTQLQQTGHEIAQAAGHAGTKVKTVINDDQVRAAMKPKKGAGFYTEKQKQELKDSHAQQKSKRFMQQMARQEDPKGAMMADIRSGMSEQDATKKANKEERERGAAYVAAHERHGGNLYVGKFSDPNEPASQGRINAEIRARTGNNNLEHMPHHRALPHDKIVGGTITGGHVEDEHKKPHKKKYSATQDSGTQAREYNKTHQAYHRVDPGRQREVRNQYAPINRDSVKPLMNMGQSTQGGAVKKPIAQYDYHKDYGMHVGDNERRRMQKIAMSGAYGLDELQADSHNWHAKITADQISKGGSIGTGGSVIPEPVRKDLLETRSQEHYFGRPVLPPREGPEAIKMERSKLKDKPLHTNVNINNPDLTRRDIAQIRMGEYNPNLHPRGNPGRPHHVKMRPHHAFADPNKASAGTIR